MIANSVLDVHQSRRCVDPAIRLRRLSTPSPNGCILWTGALREGYGAMSFARVGYRALTIGAHRVAYELRFGRIPDGLQLDHLCHNRACINPDHLEPVTPRENALRSVDGPSAVNARKTHCVWGHEFTDANTRKRMRNGTVRRDCRECSRQRCARRRDSLRSAA